MKHIALIICILIASQTAFSQSIPFHKEFFPDQKKELKEARKNMKKGIKLSRKGEKRWETALEKMLAANRFNPDNAALNQQIGQHFYLGPDPWKALPWFEKAISLDSLMEEELYFYLATTCHLNHQFKKAHQYYASYLSTLKPRKAKKEQERIKVLQEQTLMGDSLIKDPETVFVDNMGERINSRWPEYGNLLNHDKSRLWFNTTRPLVSEKKPGEQFQYRNNIYYLQKYGHEWSDPVNAGPQVNEGPEMTILAVDSGQQLLYVFDNIDERVQVISADGSKFKTPKKFLKRINKKGAVTGMCFSADYKTLYFVSNRPKGEGGKDIWIITHKKKKKWNKPQNAGPEINTPGDEASPFLSMDGKTLYFSSTGHPGMGGYDIFFSESEGETWGKARHAGYPINSASDDLYFLLMPKGNTGFLSSNRANSLGQWDLYTVRFVDQNRPLMLTTDPPKPSLKSITPLDIKPLIPEKADTILVLLNGLITDQKTGDPVSSTIKISRESNPDSVTEIQTQESTGEFHTILHTGSRYHIAVNSRGYLPYTAQAEPDEEDPFEVLTMIMPIKPLQNPDTFFLNFLPFYQERAEYPGEALPELNALHDFMITNPGIRISVTGFSHETEERTSLAQSRAASVERFLLDKGIQGDRIELAATNADGWETVGEEELHAVRIIILSEN